MSAECVRNYYKVNYKQGDRVTVNGKPGTITSFPQQYINVLLDGETKPSKCHPTWKVELITDEK